MARAIKLNLLVVLLFMQDDKDDDWFPEDIVEAFKELRERKVFDVSDMYTIADAWGWTWERELKSRPPQRWSQEREVELAMRIMQKACSLSLVLGSSVLSIAEVFLYARLCFSVLIFLVNFLASFERF